MGYRSHSRRDRGYDRRFRRSRLYEARRGGGRVIGDEREIKKLIAMVGRLEDGFNEVVYEMSEYIEGGPDDFEFDELAWNFGDFMDDFWVLSKGLKEVYGDALTSVSAGAHDVMNAHKDLEDALIAYEGKCLGVSYDRVDDGHV